jgi:lysosomal alpha-mannosidase
METRILNYRPTWHFKPSSHQNISLNYYPVTSAIAVRDRETANQLTVMTTRTQGGTVLDNGKIELMQSRRLNFAD